MLSPMGVRGSSDAYGSWKMICIRRRYGRRSAPWSVGDVLAVEHDGAGGGVDEPQEQPPDGGLAAARLAHQAERLAALDDEIDAVHGAHLGDGPLEHAGAHGEGLDEALDLDQGRRMAGRRRSGGASVTGARRRQSARDGHGRASRPVVGVGPLAAVRRGGTASSGPSWPGRHARAAPGWSVRGQHVVVVDARRAARCEAAAGGQRDQVGHAARDDRQLIQQHARHGHRADEAPGVGMLRRPEQGADVAPAPRSRRRTSPRPGRPSRRPRPGRG